MNMSTHVYGLTTPTAKVIQMREVDAACAIAGIKTPSEVVDYLKLNDPEGGEINLERLPCCKEYNDDRQDGFEINVASIPDNIKTIRFFNSY